MLNVEKLRGSPESDRLSVTQTSIVTAATQASGVRNMLFNDSDLLFFAAPCLLGSGSPPPPSLATALPPPSCTEKNVAVAGMHLKSVRKKIVTDPLPCLPEHKIVS